MRSKKYISTLKFTPADLTSGLVTITNKYDFTNLSVFNISWEVLADGVLYNSGHLGQIDLGPGKSSTEEIPYGVIKPEPGVEYYLNLYVSRADEWGIVPQDHQYASEQMLLPFHADAASAGADNLALVDVQTEGTDLTVAGEGFTVVFDMSAGVMKSLRAWNHELSPVRSAA